MLRDFQPNPRTEAALDALGNSVRRDIVRLLAKGPMAAGEVASHFPISRPAVSKHLRTLEAAAIIAHETRGNRNIYRLDQTGFAQASGWLDAFWSEAFQRMAMVAENTDERGLG